MERQSTAAWFRALQLRHIPVDIVYLREGTTADDLAKYEALVYAHPAIMEDRTAAVLSNYVHHGGHLILGCRTGYKDISGHCCMRPLPGPVADLCGVRVDDFTLIGPYQTAPTIAWEQGVEAEPATADGFNDILAVTSANAVVLARYEQDYYAGAPALVCNRYGAGSAYYYGAAFNGTVAEALIDHCGLKSPAEGLMSLPRDVELCIRTSPLTGDSLWFLLNYSASAQPLVISGSHVNIATGATVGGATTIEPYDVLVLRVEA